MSGLDRGAFALTHSQCAGGSQSRQAPATSTRNNDATRAGTALAKTGSLGAVAFVWLWLTKMFCGARVPLSVGQIATGTV